MPTPRKITSQSADIAAIVVTQEHQSRDISDIKSSISGINKSLEVLGRIEERQMNVMNTLGRGDKVMVDHDIRIKVIEQKIPQLEETRTWVIKGVTAGVSMLCVGIIAIAGAVLGAVYMPRAQTFAAITQPPLIQQQ